MHRIGRVVAALAIQLALVFGILEVAGRVLDPLGISYYPETARFYDDLALGGPLGYQLPPGMDARYWDTAVRTNSLGMRDREVGPKAPGERRIMLLGDSVIFSLGVDYEDSIPWRLEQRLNAGGDGSYRVLNMGVPSYNTEQELLQLENTGLALAPDAVLLMFVPNDVEKMMWVYEKRRDPLANLAQRSYAASVLFVLARELRTALARSGGGGGRGGAATIPADRRAAVDAALTQMTRLLGERGIPFVVVSRGSPGEPHLAMLAELSALRGFRFALLDAAADPNRTTADPMGLVVSRTNTHCNAAGCEAIARSVETILRDAGMLGAAGDAR